jgi:hypothetical protein
VKADGVGKYMCQKCHAVIDGEPLRFRGEVYHPYHFNCTGILIISVVDPVPFLPRDPGWVKIRIRIRDEQLESYFRELRNKFLG